MTPLRDVIRLKLERLGLLFRARRSFSSLKCLKDPSTEMAKDAVLLFFCARNEANRLPHFFEYYRNLGVNHFFAVDNGSTDGTSHFLTSQRDCSVWYTEKSYRHARFGMDWMNALLGRFANGHWTFIVDPDEYFVYPHQETRPLPALLEWMDAGRMRTFGAMLLDMYPKAAPNDVFLDPGTDPLIACPYFDPQNYQSRVENYYFNLWIQGGPRQRAFFDKRPEFAPALNKIPLVKWSNGMVYRSSTHQLLPRSLNVTYSQTQIPKPSGALLHFKFVTSLGQKVAEELQRKEHFAGSREYRAYLKRLDRSLWTEHSVRYEGWKQLEELGLMGRGDWV